MKKIYLTICLIGSITLLQSNNSKEQINYEEQITGGMTCVLIQHDIQDFNPWKKAYDSDAERRTKAGMNEMLVCDNGGDKKSISVILGIESVEESEAFFGDPETGKLMGEAGAVGPPSFIYFNVKESSVPNGHSYMIIHHKVEDYNTWKKAFDAHQKERAKYGIDVVALGTIVGDDNHVIAVMNSASSKNFINFLEKSDLKEAMKEAGLASEPVTSILSEVI